MKRPRKSGEFDFQDAAALVVDDEQFSRTVVGQALRSFGCARVDAAVNGQAAIELMRRATRSYDVVVADVRMPGMDGLEMLKRIRCGTPGVARDTVVGILTGVTDEDVVGAVFNLDADFFVAKPPIAETLKARLIKALTTSRDIRTPEEYEAVTAADAAQRPVEKRISALRGAAKTGGQAVYACPIGKARAGSILGADVRTSSGTLVLQAGFELTPQLLERLKNLAEFDPIVRSIKVRAPTAG